MEVETISASYKEALIALSTGICVNGRETFCNKAAGSSDPFEECVRCWDEYLRDRVLGNDIDIKKEGA